MRCSWSVWFGYSLALTWIGSVEAPERVQAQAAQSGSEQAEAEQLQRMIQQYMTRGADATTIGRGQPGAGADFYRNGANALTVPSGKDPGADFYRRGADSLSVGSDPDYFRNGASSTSVPQGNAPDAEYFRNGGQATKVPSRGEPGAEYFNDGARATKLPSRGEPGAELYTNGATATSLNAATKPPRRVEKPVEPEPPPAEAEPAAAEPAAAESGEPKAEAPAAAEAAAEPAPEAADAPPEIAPTPEPSNSAPAEAPKADVKPLPEDKGEHAALVPAKVEAPKPPSAFAHLVDRYARGVRVLGVALAGVLGALVFTAIWFVRRSRGSAKRD
jgi:hypothetical protein